MGTRSRKINLKIPALALWFLFSACAPIPYLFLQYGTELKQINPTKIAADNPLAPNENVKMTTVGAAALATTSYKSATANRRICIRPTTARS